MKIQEEYRFELVLTLVHILCVGLSCLESHFAYYPLKALLVLIGVLRVASIVGIHCAKDVQNVRRLRIVSRLLGVIGGIGGIALFAFLISKLEKQIDFEIRMRHADMSAYFSRWVSFCMFTLLKCIVYSLSSLYKLFVDLRQCRRNQDGAKAQETSDPSQVLIQHNTSS